MSTELGQVFDQSGYSIIDGVISPAECDQVITHLTNNSPRRTKAGLRNLMSNELVRKLASDPRLIAITESLFGKPLVPFKATLFEKRGKANWLVAWHQDTALPLEKNVEGHGWGPSSAKEGVTFVNAPTWAVSKILALRIQLDASTNTNGPLRVIPGSHQKRHRNDDEFDVWSKREAITCIADKGSVIAMSPLLVHASSKRTTDEPRRVLHIEYSERLELTSEIRLAIA
jgi:ectoine hydroxylase-related dioxygenase (phytanoyl-CoA dioxygenase family)